MKHVLIATHGKMASGIRYTAEMIAGEQTDVTTIDAYVDAECDVEKEFDTYFEERKGQRVFVMTDLMGGSVNQKLMQYAAKDDKITLITGMNLPVLLQILFAEEDADMEELKQYVEDARQELQIVGLTEEERSGTERQDEDKRTETEESQEQVGAEEQAAVINAEASKVDYEHSTAKISALRIDDRLIHGQVAMTWTRQLKVQGILVANDDAAGDNTQKMALKMAVPSGIKVLIKPVDEAIRVLNYPKASQMRILVLTRTVKDALKIRKSVGEIEFLNLGNTGRFDGIDISEKQIITPTIMLTEAEVEAAKELAELDSKFCMQQVPNDEQKLVKEVIGNWK